MRLSEALDASHSFDDGLVFEISDGTPDGAIAYGFSKKGLGPVLSGLVSIDVMDLEMADDGDGAFSWMGPSDVVVALVEDDGTLLVRHRRVGVHAPAGGRDVRLRPLSRLGYDVLDSFQMAGEVTRELSLVGVDKTSEVYLRLVGELVSMLSDKDCPESVFTSLETLMSRVPPEGMSVAEWVMRAPGSCGLTVPVTA